MFEHFGLRDVFSTIKKNSNIILAILLIAAFLGSCTSISKTKNVYTSSIDSNANIYSSSASYFITANNKTDDSDLGVVAIDKKIEGSKQLVNEIISLLKTDICRDYVSKKVFSNYTKEQFAQIAVVDSKGGKLNAKDITEKTIESYFKANNNNNSMLLNTYVETYSKDLSNTILNAYKDYINEVLTKVVVLANIDFVGGTDQVILSGQHSTQSPVLTSKKQIAKSIIKTVFIFILLSAAAIIVVCCFIALFNPTLNRKSDFSPYNIPVIGEVNYSKCKEELK